MTFTDAVVAVAITLLVLSIVDIRGTSQEQTVWQVIADNASELITFGFTFFVVATLWMVHNRVFSALRGFDGTVVTLNLLWLFGIVLLPWPSALAGEGIGIAAVQGPVEFGSDGTGMFYWGTIAFISVMAGLLSWHLDKHPELVNPDLPQPFRHPLRRIVYPVVFLSFGIATLILPVIGSWLPMLLIPVSIAFGRAERRKSADA